MIFPVKRVKEELINEFAVSKMTIDEFSKIYSIQPEALKSWIQEKIYKSQHPESESTDIFQASEFVELDIPPCIKTSDYSLNRPQRTYNSQGRRNRN